MNRFDREDVAFVIALAALILAIAAFPLSGCASALKDVEDVAKDQTVPDKLRACRSEARSAYYLDGKSEKDSLAVYDACKKKAGL